MDDGFGGGLDLGFFFLEFKNDGTTLSLAVSIFHLFVSFFKSFDATEGSNLNSKEKTSSDRNHINKSPMVFPITIVHSGPSRHVGQESSTQTLSRKSSHPYHVSYVDIWMALWAGKYHFRAIHFFSLIFFNATKRSCLQQDV